MKKIDKKEAARIAVETIEKAYELKRTRANDLKELAAKHAEKANEIGNDIAVANARLTAIERDEDGGRINELRRIIRTMAKDSFKEMETASNYEDESRNLLSEIQSSAIYVTRVDDNGETEILSKKEYEKQIENLSTWGGVRFYRNYTSAGYVPTRVTFGGHGTPYSYIFGTLEDFKEWSEG